MKGIISDELMEIVVENILHPTAYDVMSGNAGKISIKEFASTCAGILLKNQKFPKELKTCLIEFLLKIGSGKSPDEAFNFKKGSKRKADNGQNRIITFAVILGIKNRRMKVKDAIYEAANMYHKTTDTVSKIYYRHKNEVMSAIRKAKKQLN